MQPKPYEILNKLCVFHQEKLKDKWRRKIIIDQDIDNVEKLTEQFLNLDVLKPYDLQKEDIPHIAIMWIRFIKYRKRKIRTLHLQKLIYDCYYDTINNLDIIYRLLERKILITATTCLKVQNNSSNGSEIVSAMNVLTLLQSRLSLSRDFIKIMFDGATYSIASDSEGYKSNKEFLKDWLKYISLLENFKTRNWKKDSIIKLNAQKYKNYEEMIRIKNIIDNKSKLSNDNFPLQDLKSEHLLDEKEMILLMYLVQKGIQNKKCTISSALQMISLNQLEVHDHKHYLEHGSKLVDNGLVEIPEIGNYASKSDSVRITPDILNRILDKKPLSNDARVKQIIKYQDIFSYFKPLQSFQNLILPENLKTTIRSSLAQYSSDTTRILEKWQLEEYCSSYNSNNRYETTLKILFYGAPGTGKTFGAGAIAQALDKKILITDISRLQSKWVGESAKKVRQIFAIYNRIIKYSDNPPVLLLNEVDQFLWKRITNAVTSTEKIYNSIQNIFLEGLEHFQGILIATTNFKENLDPAFSRRFHLKLEFPFPSATERCKLWKMNLPESIPGADSIDIKYLAEKYSLSGGQIKIIVRNACVEAASRAGRKKLLSIQDLIKYIELETSSSFNNRKTIGF